jgi:hypothetical protein
MGILEGSLADGNAASALLESEIFEQKCSLTIFFDNHFEPSNEIIIAGIMGQLKEQGYNTICIETDHKRTWSQYLSYLTENLAKASKLDEETKKSYDIRIKPQIEILKKVHEHKINFFPINMSEAEINECNAMNKDVWLARNQAMAGYIDEACTKYGGKIIVFVGLSHNELQTLLAEKGYHDIKSIWALEKELKNLYQQHIAKNINANREYFPLGLSIIDLRNNYSALQTLETQLGLEPGKFTQVEYEAIYKRIFA